MQRTVRVACFRDELPTVPAGSVIIAVDVIRATTTALTAIATGRRCFPVDSVAAAWQRANEIDNALTAGEQAGELPDGFEMNNSPAHMHRRTFDVARPAVLLSSSGTKLLVAAARRHVTYCACLRNLRATIDWAARQHDDVTLVGAGTRGEFREEDQITCSWMAADLTALGFEADTDARDLMQKWQGRTLEDIRGGKSAAYLRRSNQLEDLEFVLSHVNDLELVCMMAAGELVLVGGDDANAGAS